MYYYIFDTLHTMSTFSLLPSRTLILQRFPP
jgi:hypothetical protein